MHLKDDELVSGLVAPGIPPLLAATYARVPTGAGVSRLLGPLGNYLIDRPAARSAAQDITEQTEVPLDAAVVLGLSADELHVWSADPMLDQVHDHLGHVPLARITAMDATPGRSWQPLTITLDDGQEITLEARGAVHHLVAEFASMPRTM
ncbi:MAG: hypothetical protein WAK82_02370 [Streptosporangiaceae bacterium]